MFHMLARTFLSLGLGAALALTAVAASQLVTAPAAHAQQLETEDILDSSFGETAGLGQADLKESIAGLIRVVLGFLGVVAVVIVLMGGFKWMTAGGNDEKVEEAKRLLLAGVIGLAIILSAYAITSFVVASLITATT
jgi:heme/copper-type cytochrome/quinol oxidase subunit 2